MARHLSDSEILRVADGIAAWQGRLTWNALTDACESWIGRKPSRQALARSARIASDFAAKKNSAKLEVADVGRPVPPTMKIALAKMSRLEAEVERLSRENTNLLDQFRRWQYNAYRKGVSREELNRALPAIDLNPTKKR